MPNYHRAWHPGAIHFFTLVLEHRKTNAFLIEYIDILRNAVRKVKHRHPFKIHAWVVLPDHLHCILELPEGEADFAMRLRLIKADFSRNCPRRDKPSISQWRHGERGIWQRRYWEHLIRDEEDYLRHMDYAHFNPVKHGLVGCVKDWPYSTFRRLVEQGFYPADWGGACDVEGAFGDI